jgi:hypothetical protein
MVKSEASDLQGKSSTLNKHGMKNPRDGPRNKLKQDLKNQIKNTTSIPFYLSPVSLKIN